MGGLPKSFSCFLGRGLCDFESIINPSKGPKDDARCAIFGHDMAVKTQSFSSCFPIQRDISKDRVALRPPNTMIRIIPPAQIRNLLILGNSILKGHQGSPFSSILNSACPCNPFRGLRRPRQNERHLKWGSYGPIVDDKRIFFVSDFQE